MATASASSLQVSLSWSENDSNVIGFKIERSTAGGPYTQIGTSNITSYTDTAGLAYGTTYTYRVAAYNIAGSNSATSNAVSTVPATPTNLTATANSQSQITLNWTNNSNSLGIKIERRSGGSYSEIATVGATVTTYADTPLAPSTTYSYRVRAFNNGGNSGYSNESSATTIPCDYVISPTTASFGEEGGAGSITVSAAAVCSWSATSNVSWITITSGASGAGGGSVNYSVGPFGLCNRTRQGQITIGGRTFTIEQSGSTDLCCIDRTYCLIEQPEPTILGKSATGVGTGGLTARYFGNTTLKGQPALHRTDAAVNFNWAVNRPDKLLPADGFSARWSGQLAAPSSEAYTFYLYSDGGARLWVNNQLVIDRWRPSSEQQSGSAPVELKAGEKADVRIEYYSSEGKAAIYLMWNSASTPKQIIPQRYLYQEATTEKSAQADANKQKGMLPP